MARQENNIWLGENTITCQARNSCRRYTGKDDNILELQHTKETL